MSGQRAMVHVIVTIVIHCFTAEHKSGDGGTIGVGFGPAYLHACTHSHHDHWRHGLRRGAGESANRVTRG